MPTIFEDNEPARSGSTTCSFHADDAAASRAFREAYASRMNLVRAEDMPFERSADGLIKHLVHSRMNTKECCVEAYMQFLAPGERSGKHRHMWEEVLFVVEGCGYDRHWALRSACLGAFDWDWAEEEKRFGWKHRDFICVPPFTIHQRYAGDAGEARLIVISNRIVKAMGYDWCDQL